MRRLFQYYLDLKKRRNAKSASLSFPVRLLLPVIGLLALIWFLIRVIPKPSRAAYPCQRIAFPLASSFILWMCGLFGAFKSIRKAQYFFAHNKRLVGFCFLFSAVLFLWAATTMTSQKPLLAAAPVPNDPIGVAKGIYPGRVVWVHDPNATSWVEGIGHPWEPENTSQRHVDAMVAKSIRQISGAATDAQGWDAIFRYFNQTHNKGDVGYIPGEKITIKVNLTTCNAGDPPFDPETYDYDKSNKSWWAIDKSDTSPQMIVALLRQLVFKAGVDPNDIAVGDTLSYFPDQWWEICHTEFPQVTYFDRVGGKERILSTPSTVRQYWSHSEGGTFTDDFIPQLYADADYLINQAVLKGHSAGITLCAKNHYGSYNRRPIDAGFYNLHNSIAGDDEEFNPLPAQYRALVDIMGHPDMGAKTLLYMVDGLYGGYRWEGTAYRLQGDPFYNDWPSSLLVSLDPVAIDSVGMDILWEQWPSVIQVGGVDDYLIEAALADSPPSGTFYDPDGDGIRLESLGVHERWNNSVDRQYSRNLGTGDGIELIYIKMPAPRTGDINSDTYVDVLDLMQLVDQWLWMSDINTPQILEDIDPDGAVNIHDFLILSENWD